MAITRASSVVCCLGSRIILQCQYCRRGNDSGKRGQEAALQSHLPSKLPAIVVPKAADVSNVQNGRACRLVCHLLIDLTTIETLQPIEIEPISNNKQRKVATKAAHQLAGSRMLSVAVKWMDLRLYSPTWASHSCSRRASNSDNEPPLSLQTRPACESKSVLALTAHNTFFFHLISSRNRKTPDSLIICASTPTLRAAAAPRRQAQAT